MKCFLKLLVTLQVACKQKPCSNILYWTKAITYFRKRFANCDTWLASFNQSLHNQGVCKLWCAILTQICNIICCVIFKRRKMLALCSDPWKVLIKLWMQCLNQMYFIKILSSICWETTAVWSLGISWVRGQFLCISIAHCRWKP